MKYLFFFVIRRGSEIPYDEKCQNRHGATSKAMSHSKSNWNKWSYVRHISKFESKSLFSIIFGKISISQGSLKISEAEFKISDVKITESRLLLQYKWVTEVLPPKRSVGHKNLITRSRVIVLAFFRVWLTFLIGWLVTSNNMVSNQVKRVLRF